MYQPKEGIIEIQLREKEESSSVNLFAKGNKILIEGNFQAEFESYQYGKEECYRTQLKEVRPSGKEDIISIVVPRELLPQKIEPIKNRQVEVAGQIRSADVFDANGKRHLNIFLLAKAISFGEEKDDEETINAVYLEGVVCNQPKFHVTFYAGKRITAFLLAVHRKGRNSDYIPCIACESTARLARQLKVGDKIKLYGRLHSRVYFKPLSSDSSEGIYKTVYEVYINSFTKIYIK